MLTAKVRKSIYALSAPVILLLTVLGVDGSTAAAWVAAGLAVANVIMAFANVPGEEETPGDQEVPE